MTRSMIYCSIALLALAFASRAYANLILNGSFENNTAGSTQYNMDNGTTTATVADITAFGSASEIDIITFGGYGLAPQDGDWKLAIHGGPNRPAGTVDAFAFNLSAPIIAGQLYTLDFYAHAETTFDPGHGPIEIGISGSNSSFGTLFYTTTSSLSETSWDHINASLVAPVGGAYLTVQSGLLADTWAHIDNFSLDAVPEPASLLTLAVGLLLLSRRRSA